jgi:tungstate transport system substrate-binding protein
MALLHPAFGELEYAVLTKRALLFGSAIMAGTSLAFANGRAVCISIPSSLIDTGFSSYLAAQYATATGRQLSFVEAVGGQASNIAALGCTPVLIVNHAGFASNLLRAHLAGPARTMMQNDFVIAGPTSDPASVLWVRDAATALKAIARAKCTFISRSDQSGTHSVEAQLWTKAGVHPVSRPGYIQSGLSMHRALDLACAENAYILVDRATWLAQQQPSKLRVLFEGGPDLVNVYSVILMDPKTQPSADMEAAGRLTDWLVSEGAKSLISNFRIAGQPVFHVS